MREKPVRVLVYNSDYYISGPGSRGGVSVALSGLHGNGSVAVRRLTGSSADAVLGNGTVSIAGRGFGEKCQLEGEERIERIDVIDGTGKIEVGSAEAVVVYLE